MSVLLIHSGGFTSRQWRKLAEGLAPHHRVIVPDLLGYTTPWPVGEPFHFRQDVDHLATLLDGPTHLVGHSYGGFLALQLALVAPDRVASLAVYEPVAFGVLDEPADPADAAALASLAELRPYELHDDAVDEAWLAGFVDWWNGAGTWGRMAEDTRQAMRGVAWKLSQEVASLAADRTDRVGYGRITVPTLLLAGARTQPAERRVVDKLAVTMPGARLQVFEDLGHMGPITHARIVNAAIADFLAAQER